MITRELAPDVHVGFRPMEEGDRKFIISSWLRGYLKAGDWPRRLGTPRCNVTGVSCTDEDKDLACGCCRFTHRRYWDEHGRVVEQLLERSTVVVACNPEKPEQILGYVVAEPDRGVLHWVFVKTPFRYDPAVPCGDRPNIGTHLLDRAMDGAAPITCSHWTKVAGKLRLQWHLTYDPFLLEELTKCA